MPRQRDNAGIANPRNIQNAFIRAQCALPFTTKLTAAETRRTNSAAPAVPVGNIEKSLCTNEMLSGAERPGNPFRRVVRPSFR